jgi:hypothetical protein
MLDSMIFVSTVTTMGSAEPVLADLTHVLCKGTFTTDERLGLRTTETQTLLQFVKIRTLTSYISRRGSLASHWILGFMQLPRAISLHIYLSLRISQKNEYQ